MMMQGFNEDPTMPDFLPGIMDVYMDGIEMVLTQADRMTVTMEIGPEDFTVRKHVSFTEGSQLAEMLVPVGGRDMLELLPAGDLATVRFRMPGEMAYGITSAFMNVFAADFPEDNMRFWASMAGNAGVALYRDYPLHLVAAYEMPGEVSLEEIAATYTEYTEIVTSMFDDMPEVDGMFTMEDRGVVQLDGVDYYSMSMSIEADTLTSMNFDYWMTVHDGALLIEMAPEPMLLPGVVSGNYDPASLEASGDMAGEMSLAGYISMIMAFSPAGADLPEVGSDVIIRWNGGFENGSINMEMTLNGADALATGFALFGLLSATM